LINDKTMAIVLGGLVPAVLFGVSGLFQKLNAKAGTGTGPFLIGVGVTVVLVGALFCLLERDLTVNGRGILATVLYGAVWAVGTGTIALAIRRYNGQISQLVPLYNMNTLVAVLIGLVVFAEWKTVNPLRILISSALIIAGGILASRA
jgi:uncharacterized membrane protein